MMKAFQWKSCPSLSSLNFIPRNAQQVPSQSPECRIDAMKLSGPAGEPWQHWCQVLILIQNYMYRSRFWIVESGRCLLICRRCMVSPFSFSLFDFLVIFGSLHRGSRVQKRLLKGCPFEPCGPLNVIAWSRKVFSSSITPSSDFWIHRFKCVGNAEYFQFCRIQPAKVRLAARRFPGCCWSPTFQ